MARPTVRTAVVAGETVELLTEIFGSAANAFKNLRLEDVTYPVFQRALHGGTVTPRVVQAIEAGWGRWQRSLVRRVTGSGEFDVAKEA
jgi:hypothetical protein